MADACEQGQAPPGECYSIKLCQQAANVQLSTRFSRLSNGVRSPQSHGYSGCPGSP